LRLRASAVKNKITNIFDIIIFIKERYIMEERLKFLLSELTSGDNEAMERAAALISRSDDAECIKKVSKLLNNKNSKIRINAIIILSAAGDKKLFKKIEKLKRKDNDENVRIAASVALKNFGNLEFQKLKSKVKKTIIDKVYKKDIELPDEEIFGASASDEKVFKSKRSLIFKIAGMVCFLIFLAIIIIFHSENIFKFKLAPEGVPGVKKINELLNERRDKIYNFKKDYLQPGGAYSKFPMTVSIPTYFGDSYSDVVYSVYDAPEFQKSGMNTMLAFWRKHNFTSLADERREDLFQLKTDGEKLIFPNYSAMRINFNLEKGSVAEQAINKTDSVEINVIVDKVILK